MSPAVKFLRSAWPAALVGVALVVPAVPAVMVTAAQGAVASAPASIPPSVTPAVLPPAADATAGPVWRPVAGQPPALGLRGWAVPIGGGLEDDNHAVWQRLVQVSGGRGARWVVLGTASIEPAQSAAHSAANLRRHGAQTTVLPVSPLLKGTDVAAAVRDPALLAQVRQARGVFFTGGAQQRIVDALMPGGVSSPMLQAIRELLARGGVVAGTSAGAAMQSNPMFIDAPDPLGALQGHLRPGVEYGPGLGFVGAGVFVDQHFLRRGRIGRLLPVMVATGQHLGLGVEENTAMFFHGDEVEVVGAKSAVLVDLSAAEVPVAPAAPFSLRGARVSLIDHGDRVNLRSGALTPSAAKRAGQYIVPGDPAYTPEYEDVDQPVDMLGDNVFANAMTRLIDSRADELLGLAFRARPLPGQAPGPGFLFRLVKDGQSRGWYSEAVKGDGYTVSRLRLDVSPVRIAEPFFQVWQAWPGACMAPGAAGCPPMPASAALR